MIRERFISNGKDMVREVSEDGGVTWRDADAPREPVTLRLVDAFDFSDDDEEVTEPVYPRGAA